MTSDEMRDAAILGRIVERVGEKNQFCGETLLQKSAYFLKEMFGAPVSVPFRIYYYGPFSFDLRHTLTTMESVGIVQTVAHEWGASYRVGRNYPQVAARYPKTLKEAEPAIDWVIRELSPLGVKELEPLATALYLRRESPEASDETLAKRLNEIKPHVSVSTAFAALQKVQRWMDEQEESQEA